MGVPDIGLLAKELKILLESDTCTAAAKLFDSFFKV
jgi:hypothetical protein